MNIVTACFKCPGAELAAQSQILWSGLLFFVAAIGRIALSLVLLIATAPFLVIGFLLAFSDWCAEPLTRDDDRGEQ